MGNEEKILEMLTALSKGQEEMRSDITALSKGQEEMRSDIEEMRSDIAAMKTTLAEHGAMLKVLDERSLKSAVILETDVPRDLHLLYEGHKTMLETLAPKDRLEIVEEKVITVESIVKTLSKRVTTLEKAQ